MVVQSKKMHLLSKKTLDQKAAVWYTLSAA
jgi:hypothetical protein